MDTGALYRAVALNLWRWGGNPGSVFEAVRACEHIAGNLDDPELRSEPVSAIASKISVYPAVREALFQRQREFARQPGGAVLDGRDIGTIIAPDADVKLFVTASEQVRATRRVRELLERGMPAHFDDVLCDLQARDSRDSNREAAPLSQADDAIVLDTSEMDVDAAVSKAVALAEERLRHRS
jgi:cytidylate kinase